MHPLRIMSKSNADGSRRRKSWREDIFRGRGAGERRGPFRTSFCGRCREALYDNLESGGHCERRGVHRQHHQMSAARKPYANDGGDEGLRAFSLGPATSCPTEAYRDAGSFFPLVFSVGKGDKDHGNAWEVPAVGRGYSDLSDVPSQLPVEKRIESPGFAESLNLERYPGSAEGL